MSQIKQWPSKERPREKLLEKGAQSLSDAELLAIFLRTGVAGKNAVDLSRDLLAHAGGLRAFFRLPTQIMCQYPGLGQAKSAQLQAGLELGKRYWKHSLDAKAILDDRPALHRYLIAQLSDCARETFACVLLDLHDRMLRFDCLAVGTLKEAAVYPREVVKHVLLHNAASVILVHNHPSGCTKASQADKHLTLHLKRLLDEVSVRVVDHIIVGHGACLSFCEQGWL